MSRIYRSLPPKGTTLGIAFSGGLDTRCAVAWLAEQGMQVHAYTADLAQPDEKNPADIPPIALEHGAVKARLIDCREAMVREGIAAIQCGAFHLGTAGKKYFNTTPLGRAVTSTAIVRAMLQDDVHVFGDGSTRVSYRDAGSVARGTASRCRSARMTSPSQVLKPPVKSMMADSGPRLAPKINEAEIVARPCGKWA